MHSQTFLEETVKDYRMHCIAAAAVGPGSLWSRLFRSLPINDEE